mgnify:CR=1 FL=1
MAETIKNHDFKTRTHGRQKYDWVRWLNGQIWVISCGTKEQYAAGEVDAPVSPTSFANNASSKGKRDSGIKEMKISIDTDAGKVYLQAVRLPDAEEGNEE